jgi:hypothetical protein
MNKEPCFEGASRFYHNFASYPWPSTFLWHGGNVGVCFVSCGECLKGWMSSYDLDNVFFFVFIIKLCQVDLFVFLVQWSPTCLNDEWCVLDGYYNLLSGTPNVVVHEWASNLNKGMKNL